MDPKTKELVSYGGVVSLCLTNRGKEEVIFPLTRLKVPMHPCTLFKRGGESDEDTHREAASAVRFL